MTLGVELRLPTFNTNVNAINAAVHKGLIRLWKESVQEFIRAATAVMAVDTGMSVASFEPLGAKVRLATLIREISRGKGPKRGHSLASGRFADNNGPFKSRALGKRLGEKAFTLEFGSSSNLNFEFTFSIVVLQHFLLENGLGRGSSIMYNSMKLGEEAFLQYFENNFDRIIDGDKIAEMFIENRIIEL